LANSLLSIHCSRQQSHPLQFILILSNLIHSITINAALLKDIPKLTSILTYHVVSDSVRPTRNGRSYDTVNGKEISVKVTVDTVQSFIWGGQENPALVTAMDIKCDNGYIHVIDSVLIPYEGNVAPVHN
jgi:uncharacterized surface protein with fasciclin (FAS1) repeats